MTSDASAETEFDELVVCSLEPWDEAWRRNQFFVADLLERNPKLRVLFVEPATDPMYDLSSRRAPSLPRVRTLSSDRRLKALRPLKPLPRRLGTASDLALRAEVRAAARLLRLNDPILWVNDVTYAPLLRATGWPGVYDITDDWLLAPFAERELERLRALDRIAMRDAERVVVCSKALQRSRSSDREILLVPNGVDVEHLRRPQGRPHDLPPSPVAVYVGSLHDARIDVELVVALARAHRDLRIALVGPDSLSTAAREALTAEPNVSQLGPRPYSVVPAYLQHADVIVVPHRLSDFTESLDPIKGYESLAVDTPTVATPVAGFREHADVMHVAGGADFVVRVGEVATGAVPPRPSGVDRAVSWHDRAIAFGRALGEAAAESRASTEDGGPVQRRAASNSR